MSADNTLEILIQTKADLGAAKSAQAVLEKQIQSAKYLGKGYNDQQAQLDKLTGAINGYVAKNGDAAGSVEHLEFNHRGLHKIMHEIGSVTAPELGQALTGALYGPLGPAIAIGAAVEYLAKWMGETAKKTEELIEKSRKLSEATWSAVMDANNAAVEAASKYHGELAKISAIHTTIKTQEEGQLAILNAKLAAQKAILKAQEAAELAGAKGNKVAEEEIKRRYADKESAQDIAGAASEINTLKIQKYNRNNASSGLKGKADADEKSVEDLTKDQKAIDAANRLKAIKDDLAEIDLKHGTDYLATLAKQEDASKKPASFGLMSSEEMTLQGKQAAVVATSPIGPALELNETVARHNAALAKAKDAADVSIKAFSENSEAIQSLTDKINTESAVLDVRKNTSKTLGEIAAPTTIGGQSLLAERGNASAILAGHVDQVGADSQSIISELGALMAGHSVTLKQAAAMVVRADQTKDSLQAAVAAMDKTSEKMMTYSKATAKKLEDFQTELDNLTSKVKDIHNH